MYVNILFAENYVRKIGFPLQVIELFYIRSVILKDNFFKFFVLMRSSIWFYRVFIQWLLQPYWHFMVSTKAGQGLVVLPLAFPGNQTTFKENAGPINSFPDRTTGNFMLEFCLSLMGLFHCWVCWCGSSQLLNVIKNFIDVNRHRLRARTWPERRVSSLPTLSKTTTFSCIQFQLHSCSPEPRQGFRVSMLITSYATIPLRMQFTRLFFIQFHIHWEAISFKIKGEWTWDFSKK